MQLTINSTEYIGQRAVGYMVNSDLPINSRLRVAELQERLKLALGEAIWCQPIETLHITLLDWVAPLVDYQKDKDVLFSEIQEDYKDALSKALSNVEPMELRFNQLRVSSNAIFCEADDASSLNKIRKDFVNRIHFLKDTKQPPKIAHFTVARFTTELDLNRARDSINNLEIDVPVVIKEFRLVRETCLPMLKFEIIQKFPLAL